MTTNRYHCPRPDLCGATYHRDPSNCKALAAKLPSSSNGIPAVSPLSGSAFPPFAREPENADYLGTEKEREEFRKTGQIIHEVIDEESDEHREVWITKGSVHRVGGPAIIEFFNGRVSKAIWLFVGMKHRDDGPAEIWFNEDGTHRLEFWFRRGRLSRLDGPAKIRYRRDGSVSQREFAIDGDLLSEKDWVDDVVMEMRNDPDYKDMPKPWIVEMVKGLIEEES